MKRTLIVRLTDEASLTLLALDEDGDVLEDDFYGNDKGFDKICKRIDSVMHRYCIEQIVPVINDWGWAIFQHLNQSKHAGKIWRWHIPNSNGDYVPGNKLGFYINAHFMNLLPHHDETSPRFMNEEVLRKIGDYVRRPESVSSEVRG